ncbi:MAG: NIPSNAP family protein [bacterium]|nr:NIPSNAP family protein [bacterium]
MIHELQFRSLQNRGAAEYNEIFGAHLEKGPMAASLRGSFHCDIGDLNRVLHVWAYEDMAQWEEGQTYLQGLPAEKLVKTEVSKMVKTPPFLPAPLPGAHGGVYEVRTYAAFPGAIESSVFASWGRYLAERETLSKCVAFFYIQYEDQEEYIHFWPYRDLNHRAEVRGSYPKINWPPGTKESSRASVISQNSEIWMPASFSPMH